VSGRRGHSRIEVDTARVFQQTLFDMQTRWGQQIVRRATDAVERQSLATGIAVLDAALRTHGIPRGQLTALTASGTSGVTTLAYCIATSVQQKTHLPVVYIDLEESFDFYYAHGCGVNLEDLLVVRPSTLQRALDMAGDFIKATNICLLILDLGVQAQQFIHSEIQARLQILGRLLRRSSCAFLCLVNYTLPAVRPLFTAQAQLALNVRRQRWLRDPDDPRTVIGCEAQVLITKDSSQIDTRAVTFPILFSGAYPGE
jgi:hypothetical protein